MSLTLRALLLVLFVSFCADAQASMLALYMEPPRGLDFETSQTMRVELRRLLEPAGLEVAWKNLADRKAGEDFELVVVASFEGSCAPDAVAPALAVAASLADTSISSGRVLPFFRVDCPRLIRMLGSQLEPSVLGRALARVIAHEIYHIVARTTDHQQNGVAKAVFSLRDLTATRFELDAWSLALMRPVPVVRPSDNSSGETGR